MYLWCLNWGLIVVTVRAEVLQDGRFTLDQEGDVDGGVAVVDPGGHLQRNSSDGHPTGGQQSVETASEN